MGPTLEVAISSPPTSIDQVDNSSVYLMLSLIWNCRGARKDSVKNHLKNLLSAQYQAHYIALDWMAGGVKAYIRSACNVGGPPRTYPLWGSPLSGGIIAVWREGKAQVDFCPVEPTTTCGVVTPVGEAPWVIEGVYAKTSVVGSRTLWKADPEVLELVCPRCCG